MHAYFRKHILQFKKPGGTSRGVLHSKESWFIVIKNSDDTHLGIGECSIIPKLSPDNYVEIESTIHDLCKQLNQGNIVPELDLLDFPAIRFALETALLDYKNRGSKKLFNSPFSNGQAIPINGLVWMGSKEFIYNQIREKIEQEYNCIKIKIASLPFEEELEILKYIRTQFVKSDIEIRLDANGGFETQEVEEKLKHLSDFHIHSIEQPIKAKQWEVMSQLCSDKIIDIALDEELIGINDSAEQRSLLTSINPQYIIIKPSLLGGFSESEKWISQAEELGIDWWVTSALESNIGLNAIAQWTSTLDTKGRHQGLGTGQLFANNIRSPLFIDNGKLYYGDSGWDLNLIINDDVPH